MIKKIAKLLLTGLLLTSGNMNVVSAQDKEESLEVALHVQSEEVQVQEQPLPQTRNVRSEVYLEAGKYLDFGTGTYLNDYGMNSLAITYEGITNEVLIQELYLNGMRVYCIEPEVLTSDGAGYQMGVANGLVSNAEQRKLGLISYFGYGYNGDTSDAMNAATIIAIWIARGREVSNVSSEVMAKVQSIQQRVDKVDVHPSFAYDEIKLKGYGKDHAITLSDSNHVLEDYQIYQDGGYAIEKDGNSLKIWLEKETRATGSIVFDRIERSAQGPQIVYVNPDGKQTLMSIYAQDSESVEFQPSLLKGNMRITKKNEDGIALANTTFQLSYQADMSNPIGTFTTGVNGYVDIAQVEPMDVYVKEIAVPEPYVLDGTIEKVSIKGGETSYFTKVNRFKKGRVSISKKDTSSKHRILTQGTQFDIYTTDHRFLESITTSADGIAKSGDLRYGSYYAKEVVAPHGYVLNENPIYFDISQDEVVIEKECYDDRVSARIQIHKQDEISGDVAQGDATLEGAIYGLYAQEVIYAPDNHQVVYEKDALINKQTIKDGNAVFEGLLLGKYYVKELVASEGYTLNPTLYPIDCSYENQTIELIQKQQVVLERVKSQAFSIIKVSTDGTTGEIPALANAEFTIKLKSDVEKLGWEQAPVAKNAKHEVAERLITDAKGYAVSQELPYGTYLVKETKTPVGTITINDFEINIQEDNRTPQTWRIFNDAPIKAHIKVIKVDEETGNTIASPFIKFKIRNLDTNEYVKFWIKYPSPYIMDTFETDASGSFTTPESLAYGRYQVEEIKAPEGYVLDETPLLFEVKKDSAYEIMEDETSIQIVVRKENKPVKGTIQIEKKAQKLIRFDTEKTEYGNRYQPIYEEGYLENVVFEIYAKEDITTLDGTVWFQEQEFVETITTTKEGPVTTKQLPLGKYLVKEVATKEGYLMDGLEYEVALTYEGQLVPLVKETLSIVNEKEKAEVSFEKVFEETPFVTPQVALKDTKFGVFVKEPLIIDGQSYLKEDDLIHVISLNDQAQGIFDLDFAGEYYVKELQSNDAYILDETKYPVRFAYQKQPQKIKMKEEIHNQTKKGNLTIVKTDEEGKTLEGVVFELSLTKDFKQILQEGVSGLQGIVQFENLAYGTYYLREKQTKENYILDESTKEIALNEKEVTLNIVNQLRKSGIQIKKVDDTKQALANVEFSLYDDEGTLLQTKLTDEFGILIFDDLINGLYHVKETKGLAGYQEMKEVLDVEIKGNDKGKVYAFEVTNTLIVKTGIEDTMACYGLLCILSFILLILCGERKKMVGQKNSKITFQRIK